MSNFGPDLSSAVQQSTPQGSVPAAPPIESLTGTSQTVAQYPVPQQTTPQVPAAPPIESFPSTPYQQQTVPAAPPMDSLPVSAPMTQQTLTTQTQDASLVEEGTCGSGSVGNGICKDTNECCSAYGL